MAVRRRHRPAPAVSGEQRTTQQAELAGPRGARSWRGALSTFTILPVRQPAEVGPAAGRLLLLWLPGIGVLLGGVAAAASVLVELGGDSPPRRLLGALLAVALLAFLTGGLHLDGLADAADGLASRRPRQQALDIMRKPDVGPMGVAALVLVVGVQVAALASLPSGWQDEAALILAVITGRVAVVRASGQPAARPEGFGALVAGSTSRRDRFTMTALLVVAVGLAAALAEITGNADDHGMNAAAAAAWLAARGLAAVLVGLLAAAWLRRAARRRLGGMTGDVFGAQIELTTAVTLLALALIL
jgi:adenosylcobinamide-GDP ribazoletransferase